MEHVYEPSSGWCSCGHHRDDGRNERDRTDQLTIAEIRELLGPTYETQGQARMTAPTKAAADALTDLVNTARTRAAEARAEGLDATAAQLDSVAKTLDGARTRLIEDGPDYIDAAWAFVDASRRMIAKTSPAGVAVLRRLREAHEARTARR